MAVNRSMPDAANAKAGDAVDVVIERDEEARTVEAPPELQKELAKSKKARERWDQLAFTHKKEMAISIRDAKQEETKQRRLAKVMRVLKGSEVDRVTTAPHFDKLRGCPEPRRRGRFFS
jgi:uncharacterized protein YdeI (YjbR/CyaY-like superfamily)